MQITPLSLSILASATHVTLCHPSLLLNKTERTKDHIIICRHLFCLTLNNRLRETTLYLSGNIQKSLLAFRLCLTEQAKSKHRSTTSSKQSLSFHALRLHHHGLVVEILRFGNQSHPAEVGLFVNLERALILEQLYIS